MSRSAQIRELNDRFRETLEGGRLLVSRGVMDLGVAMAFEIVRKVQAFDAFTGRNDPHGEHDFGSFEHEGRLIFWKIDCYDSDGTMLSPDPGDPNVTLRVLTIMLSEEY